LYASRATAAMRLGPQEVGGLIFDADFATRI